MYDSLYLCFENDRLVDLLILYKEGLIAPDEQEELEFLLQLPGSEEAYALFNTWEDEVDLTAEQEEQLLMQVHQRLGLTETPVSLPEPQAPVKKMTPGRWGRYGSAAAVLAVVITGLVYLKQSFIKDNTPSVARQNRLQFNEQPGIKTAVLTLLDGKQLVMSANRDVMVTIGSNTRVISNHGVLSFHSTDAVKAGGEYTLTTRRASTYALQLPDGSKVWLNSNSSIRFPESFTGKAREVEVVNGEVFFTVAGNAAMPFQVKTRQQTITVLGTEFNVQAFEGSATIVTALLQGKIAVAAGNKALQLQPGQQTLLQNNQLTVENIANVGDINQWTKDDWFDFAYTPLSSVMKQLENWYGIPFELSNANDASKQVTARISKDRSLAEVLQTLQGSANLTFIQKKEKIVIK